MKLSYQIHHLSIRFLYPFPDMHILLVLFMIQTRFPQLSLREKTVKHIFHCFSSSNYNCNDCIIFSILFGYYTIIR